MCLGIPGRVVERVEGYGDQLVLVDIVGGQSRVNLGMLDEDDQDLKPGEWVLIHMGFVVERVDAAAAEKAMVGLELMGRARDDQHVKSQAVAESGTPGWAQVSDRQISGAGSARRRLHARSGRPG